MQDGSAPHGNEDGKTIPAPLGEQNGAGSLPGIYIRAQGQSVNEIQVLSQSFIQTVRRLRAEPSREKILPVFTMMTRLDDSQEFSDWAGRQELTAQ